jgi:hypothetical protein
MVEEKVDAVVGQAIAGAVKVYGKTANPIGLVPVLL